jgi:hypothetical protein
LKKRVTKRLISITNSNINPSIESNCYSPANKMRIRRNIRRYNYTIIIISRRRL